MLNSCSHFVYEICQNAKSSWLLVNWFYNLWFDHKHSKHFQTLWDHCIWLIIQTVSQSEDNTQNKIVIKLLSWNGKISAFLALSIAHKNEMKEKKLLIVAEYSKCKIFINISDQIDAYIMSSSYYKCSRATIFVGK